MAWEPSLCAAKLFFIWPCCYIGCPVSVGWFRLISRKHLSGDFINYSRITCTKSLSFRMLTFSTSLTKLSVLLLQSRVYSCNVSRRIVASAPLRLQKHPDLRVLDLARTPSTCDISLGSRTLAEHEAGDFVELSVLYIIRFFSAPVQTGPGAHPASCTMGTGSFPGVKRPGRGADHPPPSKCRGQERVGLYL